MADEILSPPATKTILVREFVFLNDVRYTIRIDPSRGDTIVEADPILITKHDGKGAVTDEIEIFRAHLLFLSRRTEVIVVLDPKNDPVQKYVAELDARHTSRIAKSPTLASQE